MKTFDFQVHSKYSFDSLSDIKKIKKRATEMGIDGVAITDHETIRGGLESIKYTDSDFLFIPGQEIKTEVGDIIGLMINEQISSNVFHEVVDQINDQQGIAYLPHPSRKLKLSKKDIKENIDVLEAVNGRSTRNENLYSKRLALELNIPYAGGSDAHTIREIGKIKTIFSKDVFSLDDLKKVMIDKSIKRTILGSGSYNILNNFQSSFVGTLKTGKIKEFAKGISKKIF